MTSPAMRTRTRVADARALAREKHRRGDDPFSVVASLSDDIDAIVRDLFAQTVGDEDAHVAALAVGGYGRRELCPRSDVDLLFVRQPGYSAGRLEKLIRALWDGGLQLGHAVRTPEECYEFMQQDLSTANAVLESRYLTGSPDLHQHFLSRSSHRYRRRRGKSFVDAKLELLRLSIEDPRRTIYVVEPNLKEGACGLRDMQRVLWIENMRRGGGLGFDALLASDTMPADDVRCLRDAYAFYLKVRCALHFSNNVRQDVLERDSVPSIARELGYGRGLDDRGAVETLMGDYYRHARGVKRFLSCFLEAGARPPGLWRRLRAWSSLERITPNVSIRKRTLVPAAAAADIDGSAPSASLSGAEEILEVVLEAQEREAILSQGVRDWMRRQAQSLDPALFQTPPVTRRFRRIIQNGKRCGEILKVLHEADVLGRILPEFQPITCLVSYDGHHQFTVDEHTLKALQELDHLEADPSYPEPDFRRVFLEIRNPLALRVALLLHDIGKAAPGDHSVSGTEAATLICERLGMDEKTTRAVDFLVYRHLELFRVSELRDIHEEEVIASLAGLVESEERLKMLYLLTYIDIVSVGPGTWTRWKGAQLSELYQRTLIYLRTGGRQTDSLETLLDAADVPEADHERIRDHCSRMAAGYVRETLPERIAYHARLVDAFLREGAMQVELESLIAYHEITFCGADRPRLFADLTGLLFSEGFNVLGARIYSRSDNIVIDVFRVDVADSVQVGVEQRTARVRGKLHGIESRKYVVEDFLRQRTLTYRNSRWPRPLYGPRVTFDNQSSSNSTIIELNAGDRPGLLYDLAQAIYRLGLDLRTAKVSTLMDRGHDAFYVVERDGRKIDNPARMGEISEALKAQAWNPACVLGGPGSGN